MKLLRTLGLAAVAAMALIAVAGAGSALAADTTLCKTNANSPYCASGDSYAAKTAINAELQDEDLLYFVTQGGIEFTVKCGDSQLAAETAAASGDPQPVDFSAWTIGQCGSNKAMNNCTLLAQKADKEGTLQWNTGSKGTLSGGASWQIKCVISGILVMNCTFDLDTDAALVGGNPATLGIAETELGVSGSLCPAKATLKAADYDITSPKPAYVAKVLPPETYGTQLCKVVESPCAEANSYPKGTLLEAVSTDFEIDTSKTDFSCDEASATIRTQAGMGNPLLAELIAFDFSSCEGTWWGKGSCIGKGTPQSPEGLSAIRWIGSTNGVFEEMPVEWEFDCFSGGGGEANAATCTYQAQIDVNLLGGSPATFEFNQQSIFGGGDLLCPEKGWVSANFSVTSPSPLYVVY